MKNLITYIFSLTLLLFLASCSDDEPNLVFDCEAFTSALPVNKLQIIGSHNSYRQATTPEIMFLMNQIPDQLPEGFDPASWDYNNEPIEEQLNTYNVRSLELDVYRDPQGGLFYNRLGNAMVGLDIESGIPELNQPGLKVLHFPDFDYNSEFISLKATLNTVNAWSDAHPDHIPLYIIIEAKEDSPDLMLPGMGLTASLNFRGGAVEEIETELKELYGTHSAELIRPDDLRSGNLSLKESILQKGWTELSEARGKIIFILMADQAVIEEYTAGHPSLVGRMMFVFTDASKDEAAFLNMTDPINQYSKINEFVDMGFMVRTQADSDTYEARSGSYNRALSAINSGAQIICTDYYRPDPRNPSDPDWSDYHMEFENHKLAIYRDDDRTGCVLGEN